MPILTWASHPNAALRSRLAEYLGRGYTIEALDEDSAVVSRPKAWTRPARIMLNPFYLFYVGRRDRDDEVRLSVEPDGTVRETRV